MFVKRDEMTFPQGAQRNSIIGADCEFFSDFFFYIENAGFSKQGNIFLKHIGGAKHFKGGFLVLSVANMGDVPL